MTKFIPRDYQTTLSDKATVLLQKYKIAYLGMEVRCGKTFTSFMTIKKFGAKKVLFVTKLKAISSIKADYSHFNKDFDITVINYQSVHKREGNFDILVLDEAHGLIAGFPKPSKITKYLKKTYSHLPIIYLSGTPLIESASKAYPVFSISKYSPFKDYSTFYKWFADYGIPKQIKTSFGYANDYSNCKYDKIMDKVGHLILTYTQKQAGFTTAITEHTLEVEMQPKTYSLIKRLIKDRVVEGKDDVILGDTGVKLQICLHQLYSGTIKLDSGQAITIDDTKAKFVKNYFKDKKIAIMYCFIQEKQLLMEVFGDTITDDLEEFNSTNKNFLGQIVSTREGVSLKEADALVFFNIPFSGTSFVQGRDRMSYKGRKENNVYFICTRGGIENEILKIVRKKQNFTNKIFKKCLKV